MWQGLPNTQSSSCTAPFNQHPDRAKCSSKAPRLELWARAEQGWLYQPVREASVALRMEGERAAQNRSHSHVTSAKSLFRQQIRTEHSAFQKII